MGFQSSDLWTCSQEGTTGLWWGAGTHAVLALAYAASLKCPPCPEADCEQPFPCLTQRSHGECSRTNLLGGPVPLDYVTPMEEGTWVMGSPGSRPRRKPGARRVLPPRTGLPGHSWPWASAPDEVASVWGQMGLLSAGPPSVPSWRDTVAGCRRSWFTHSLGLHAPWDLRRPEMSGAPRTAEPGTGQQGPAEVLPLPRISRY